jgi:hypothetical protein
MRRLIIIVEGQTEEEFVSHTLQPHFASVGIHSVTPIKIRTSGGHKGGLTSYAKFKNDATRYLRSERDVIVSSLIDFFRLPTDFPRYGEALSKALPKDKVEVLEQGLADDIADGRFIPYIQLHEFEALLFTDIFGFEMLAEIALSPASNRHRILDDIQRIIDAFPNPEDINDSPETAPSKRLQKIIPGYNKVLWGNFVLEAHGIERILAKCPRFRQWLHKIVQANSPSKNTA